MLHICVVLHIYIEAYNCILYVEQYIGQLLYNMFTVSRYIVRRTHYVCCVLRALRNTLP